MMCSTEKGIQRHSGVLVSTAHRKKQFHNSSGERLAHAAQGERAARPHPSRPPDGVAQHARSTYRECWSCRRSVVVMPMTMCTFVRARERGGRRHAVATPRRRHASMAHRATPGRAATGPQSVIHAAAIVHDRHAQQRESGSGSSTEAATTRGQRRGSGQQHNTRAGQVKATRTGSAGEQNDSLGGVGESRRAASQRHTRAHHRRWNPHHTQNQPHHVRRVRG